MSHLHQSEIYFVLNRSNLFLRLSSRSHFIFSFFLKSGKNNSKDFNHPKQKFAQLVFDGFRSDLGWDEPELGPESPVQQLGLCFMRSKLALQNIRVISQGLKLDPDY